MKVSVIIPTKDRPDGLKRAVTSALAALPKTDATVVVVDDGCQVPATTVLSGFDTDRLRIVVNDGQHGPSAARNFGVRQSSADLIFFLDDDDQLIEGYCQRTMEILADLPPNCKFGHSASLYDRPGKEYDYHSLKLATGVYGKETPIHLRIAGLGMGFWIERSAFDAVGGIDEKLRVNEDTDFSIRLAKMGYSAHYTREPGVIIYEDPSRSASDQASITKSAKPLERAKGFEYLLAEHADFLLEHSHFRRKLLIRSIKYRSRARNSHGWITTCLRHRPRWEALVFGLLGTALLEVSISLRRVRSLFSRSKQA